MLDRTEGIQLHPVSSPGVENRELSIVACVGGHWSQPAWYRRSPLQLGAESGRSFVRADLAVDLEPKGEQIGSGGNRDMLFAIDLVGDRRRVDSAT